jgi:hypothetical protein
MIKTIKDIVKYAIIGVVGISGIFALMWFLGFIDWSLFKWASELFDEINWNFNDLLNYPNSWIFLGYIIGRDMIFMGLGLLLKRGGNK